MWNGSTWDDRTGGTNVINGRNESMVQLGNITVVGTQANGCFSRDATTTNNFAAVASSPNCDILLCNALNILVALGGGSSGSDAWATSDIASTSFATGGSSVAASGNLRQTPGKITAGVAWGNDIIAFKKRGVYRGRYLSVGDVIWEWTLIPGGERLGAWGPGCAVQTGDKVYFLGDQGFWSFDGTNFQPEDLGVWDSLNTTLTSGLTAASYPFTKLGYDSVTNLVTIHHPGQYSNGGQRVGDCEEFYSFHVLQKAWGYQSKMTDSGGASYSCVVDGFEVDWSNGAPSPATGISLFDTTNNQVVTVSVSFSAGNVGSSYIPKIATGKIGDRRRVTAVTKVIPRWTTSDGVGSDLSTATLKKVVPYTADSIMEAMTQGSDVTLTTDRYWADYRKTAWWHKFETQINCEAVIDGFELEQPKVGKK